MVSVKPRNPPPETIKPYRLEDQIGFVMRKASQRHGAIFTAHMVADLTATQWAALVKVCELGSVSQNQLGRETAMDVATIKGVVDRLIKRGFVTVRADPGDNRRNSISATAEGEAAIAAGIPAAVRITEETLNGLTAGERLLLIELLRKLA